MRMMIVEVPDCPHASAAAERTSAALLRAGLAPVEVERVVVRTAEEAERWGSAGSPTILVDGRDLFPTTAAPGGALRCRLYPTPQGLSGSPTVDQLVEALTALADR